MFRLKEKERVLSEKDRSIWALESDIVALQGRCTVIQHEFTRIRELEVVSAINTVNVIREITNDVIKLRKPYERFLLAIFPIQYLECSGVISVRHFNFRIFDIFCDFST
jgi:hypothetical protein